MDEEKRVREIETEAAPAEENAPEKVEYASPMKRLWAWVGVVYVVLILGLNIYNLTTGDTLTGIAGLGIAPALAGLGGSVIVRYRAGFKKGGLAVCVLLSALCFALAVLNLIQGVAGVAAQL